MSNLNRLKEFIKKAHDDEKESIQKRIDKLSETHMPFHRKIGFK